MKQIPMKSGTMRLDDLFSSAKDRVSRFAEAQVLLYRQDVNLQDYFHALDSSLLYGENAVPDRQFSANSLAVRSFYAADSACRLLRPPKVKTDVLFCPTPYFGRKTEIRFLMRKLVGLAQTGAEILCLLPQYAPFRKELAEQLESAGYGKQVKFLDPTISSNRIEGRMRAIAAKLRARAAFEQAVQILEPYGLSPGSSALPYFERSAGYVEAWERLAPSIEFDAVVARCHWYDLCSSVCRTGLQRQKPVITFQQGVVDYTLDVPINASKFVAFGASSASVLSQLNSRFFEAVGSPEPPVEIVTAGSLFDALPILPDQFGLRSVLLIDAYSVPGDPWGTRREVQALLQLAEKLLDSNLPLQRLVIRPHPHWSDHDLSDCMELVRRHRQKCEVSHPIWPLEDDLGRASVVLGIASGVLTVASAAGLPTIFLRTEQGFRIRDLECFSPEQALLPDPAFDAVSRLLTDPEHYAEARAVAMQNAGEYYAGGANATLDGAFFSSLLSKEPSATLGQGRPQ